MFENERLIAKNNRIYSLISCGVVVLIVTAGCARTAPVGTEMDTSDASAILKSSDDTGTSNRATERFDSQTYDNVDSVHDTGRDSGSNPQSDSDIDTVPVCPYECTYDILSCEDGLASGLRADGIAMPDLKCPPEMMAQGMLMCCNTGGWVADGTDGSTDTGDTESDTVSVDDSATVEDSNTLLDDTETATDSDSGPPPCECNEHQWCEQSTGKCWCSNGYTGKDCLECDPDDGFVPWPAKDGVCIPDTCSEIACPQGTVCSVDNDGRPACGCPAGLSGIDCKQEWHTLLVPPFASDVAFDSDGNGWFATDQGLLYWRFNNTPDTSDDETQWYASGHFARVNTVDIDSHGRKWIGADKQLVVLDDAGTPMNREDDSERILPADFGTFVNVAKIVLDDNDRCWLITDPGSEVHVIENISALVPPDSVPDTYVTPTWQTPFSENGMMDLAVEGHGIWMGGTAGLAYLDFGAGIDDTGDDVMVRFSDIALLSDETVSHVTLDGNGHKWITTANGVLHLDDRGQIFESQRHLWSSWSPPGDGTTERIGPVVATGPNGAKWAMSNWGSLVRIDDSDSSEVTRTDYAPRAAASWSDISIRRNVSAIALDNNGKKWLIHSGMLYVLDDKGTPMIPEDDVWTRIPKRFTPTVDSLNEAVPDAHGGAWVRGSWRSQGVPGCTDALLYVSPGVFSDGFDDVSVPYRDDVFGNDDSFCGTIHGIDATGNIWFGDTSQKWSEVFTFVRNDNNTPLNPDDDMMAEYQDDDASAFLHSALGFDPTVGAWVDSGYFSTGESLTDPGDDLFVPLAPAGTVTNLTSVAVDTAGYKWFGYNTVNIPDEGWVSSGLQCLDDGGTLQDTVDDTWVSFLEADGLPFRAIAEVQIGGNELIWLRKNIDEKKSPQFCGLENNNTPKDKSDDNWVIVYMGYFLYNGNAALIAVNDFDADNHSNVWFGTSNGVQYLHLNN